MLCQRLRGLENLVRGNWQGGQAISFPRIQKTPWNIFTDYFTCDFNVCGVEPVPILHNSKSFSWNSVTSSSRRCSAHPLLHCNHHWFPLTDKCPSFAAKRCGFPKGGWWSHACYAVAYLLCAICKIPVPASRCNLVASSGTQLASLLGPLTHFLGLVCELGLGILHRGSSEAACLLAQPWAQPAFSKRLLNELFGEKITHSPRGFYFIFNL